jgi:hypothetical protein
MGEDGAEVPPGSRPESPTEPAGGGTFSAGETGRAVGEADYQLDGGRIEVVVGEIPDPEDLAHMRWTARCDYPKHGLLGTFEERTEAEECRKHHLLEEHAGQGLN